MIFVYMLVLALVLMLPLAFTFWRKNPARNRRDAALALHRAQLDELTRDLTDGRLAQADYAAAKLEIERRLLQADSFIEAPFTGNARILLIAAILAVPVMGFALYLPGSTANVPSEPHAQWLAKQQAANAQLDSFIAELRGHLATVDPNSADASQGSAYLAEALAEQAQAITPEALALFKQSLANAPQNAPWRQLDEQRIAQATSAASP
jgi:cytochrome c-type biogenesis protein CcmH